MREFVWVLLVGVWAVVGGREVTFATRSLNEELERRRGAGSGKVPDDLGDGNSDEEEGALSGGTNNWAVIVDSSRYWYNYRHSANALSFYHEARRLGIPDSKIILMLSDDVACNSRNPLPGVEFNSPDVATRINLYDADVEVDFRGDDVNVDSFIRLLTGRQNKWTPLNKRLLTDESSNILLYMSGHGGDEFLKFQDWEIISAQDIANAISQMWEQRRYRRILFVADTCQASTLYSTITSPNVIGIASSIKDENSYSHHTDRVLGVPVIDRFTYTTLNFLQNVSAWSRESLLNYFKRLTFDRLKSTAHMRTDLSDTPPELLRVTDFFGSSGSSSIQFVRKPFKLKGD